MAEVDVKFPSADLAVMVAVPTATPETNPLELTVATRGLEDVQTTDILVALDGEMVAVSCCVLPTGMEAVVGLTEIPVTETVLVEICKLEFRPNSTVSVTVGTDFCPV